MLENIYNMMNDIGYYQPEEQTENLTYTALDLYDYIVEFKSLVSDAEEWEEEKFKSNPPRYFLFLSIKSLCKAFYGKNDRKMINGILEGEYFMETINIEDYSIVFDKMCQYEIDKGESLTKEVIDEGRSYGVVRYLHEGLFSLRKRLNKILYINGGIDGIAHLHIHPQYLFDITQEIIEGIDKKKISELDDLLELILNPLRRTFSRRELEDNYGFPNVDLQEVMADWY